MFDLGIGEAFRKRFIKPVQELVSTAGKQVALHRKALDRLQRLEQTINQVKIGRAHV